MGRLSSVTGHLVSIVLVQLFFTCPVFTQGAEIEDAVVDEVDQDLISDNGSGHKRNRDGSSPFSWRLFTISRFNYSPFKDNAFLQSAVAGFEERSGSIEGSIELTYNNMKNLAGRVDLQLLYSTLYRVDNPVFEKGYGDTVALNEAFIEYSSVGGFSMLLGRSRQVFTPGVFESPLDRHNRSSANPGDPVERGGVWNLELAKHLFTGKGWLSSMRLSIVYLPDFPVNKYGIPVKSYDPVVQTFLPAQPLERGSVDWGPEDMDGFIRLYANFFHGDLNLLWYYLGEQHQVGGSYSRYLVEFLELHGELIGYQSIHQELSPLAPLLKDSNIYFDYLLGVKLDFSQNSGLSLEYLHQDDRPETVPTGLFGVAYFAALLNLERDGGLRTPLSDYLLGALRFTQWKDRYDFFCNFLYGPADGDWFVALRLSASVNDNLRVSLTGMLPGGDSATHYGGLIPYSYILGGEVYGAF